MLNWVVHIVTTEILRVEKVSVSKRNEGLEKRLDNTGSSPGIITTSSAQPYETEAKFSRYDPLPWQSAAHFTTLLRHYTP